MRSIILLIVVFCNLFFCGCRFIDNNKKKAVTEDTFYTNTGGIDRPRLPLIKPYELLKINPNEWRIELHTPFIALSIHNVKSVNVKKGRIFIYSNGGTDIRFGNNINEYHKAWFVIDPLKQKETAIVDSNEFHDKLIELGLSNLILLSPDSLYQNFYNTGKVEWH